MDRAHPPIAASDVCRYCHKPWRRWNGSKFLGHVRCAVSRTFVEKLARVMDRNPQITFAAMALALGVTTAVIRAWWTHGKGIARR